jgi:hypothetical protein
MKFFFSKVIIVLLVVVAATSVRAEGSVNEPTTEPAAAQPEAPPASVPRPSIVPKAAEPPPAADAATDNRGVYHHARRYAHHVRYFGPFPIYWPEFARNQIHWHRIRWSFRLP